MMNAAVGRKIALASAVMEKHFASIATSRSSLVDEWAYAMNAPI